MSTGSSKSNIFLFLHASLLQDEVDSSSSWMAKEEMLKDAIEVGKVSVLEFALKEARFMGDKIDETLINKAEVA